MGKVNDMETKETQMHAHTSCLAAVTLFESERFSSTPVKFDGPALLLNNITHHSENTAMSLISYLYIFLYLIYIFL